MGIIVTCNPGSSSIKFGVFDRESDHLLFGLHLDKTDRGILTTKTTKNLVRTLHSQDETNLYAAGIRTLITQCSRHGIAETSIHTIAVRIVHGGMYFTHPTIIGPRERQLLEHLSSLAPLHNPPAVACIDTFARILPHTQIIGVFDTAFHATIPPYIREYPLPKEVLRDDIRKYGFHGISVSSIIRQLSERLGEIPHTAIVCHLGSGASITAVQDGRSMDTSMGFTPLDGLMMGTRPGHMDPGVILELQERGVLKLGDILSKRSGMVAWTGTSDYRVIRQMEQAGHPGAQMTVARFVYDIAGHISKYSVLMGGCQHLVFTGGIGQGSTSLRKQVVDTLQSILPIQLDLTKNAMHTAHGVISTPESGINAWVLPPEEDIEMYREVRGM